MESIDTEDQSLTIQLTYCRICAVLSTDEHGIYENVYKGGTLSMHTMLEKLVPSVFNAEQVTVDELMGFPKKVCRGCKAKVLEAYTLYEMSIKSGGLLRKSLSSNKNKTFIVNVTGGSTEPSVIPVKIWRKSQENIVVAASEQIVPKDAYCGEQTKDEMEETYPMLVDDHVNPSEIEDQPSYSGEENGTISSSKVNNEDNELKQPRQRGAVKRKTNAEKRTEFENQPSYTGDTLSSSRVNGEIYKVKQSRKRVATKRQTRAGNRKEVEDQPLSSGEENSTISLGKVNGETCKSTTRARKSVTAKRQTKANSKNVSQNEENISNDSPEESAEPKPKVHQFRCLLCNESPYRLPNELTEHLKTVHSDQIHCCTQCPKVFMTKAAFEHHQYCHATGRSHFCVFCDKGFQTEQLLRNHMKTHTQGTGFLCSQCGKEFSDRSNLRQHEYRHTGHKPWQCNLCPSRFSTKGYLTVHLLTHSKNKAYSCDTCGSQFIRHYSLIKHQVIHTGVRHYECEVCKMRFASAHHVKIHMRTHTGEKPYKCGYCDRAFAQKNDMLKHTKTHGKPYPCDRCDATFPVIADLRIHLKVHDKEGKSSSGISSVTNALV